MAALSRRDLLGAMLALPAPAWQAGGWVALFDGKSLDGWKASENAATFQVRDGVIVAAGPRSHLFYAGPVRGADFKNFEFEAEFLTRPGANSGIYFHTRFQPRGWPAAGFEVQINSSHRGEGAYRERKKTGSLYGVRNVYKALARDGEWNRMSIAVRGRQVEIRLNGTLLVDYVEPVEPVRADPAMERVLGHGTFALQGHDPGSRTEFRNIRVKPLPDDAAPAPVERPVVDEHYRQVIQMGAQNYPLVDYHVHLKGGLTIEEALRESRRLGIQYGIAVNCGLGFPVHTDAGAREFLDSMKKQPVFVGLQGEGREWVDLVSKETIARFDYVFTDAMTFTGDAGKRMRLWIKDEVGEIRDPQRFLDMYVDRIVGVIEREPIDIYANPTFLPEAIAADYDALWTPERIERVIHAAVKRGVAIEINNSYRLPRPPFIRRAKAAGAKFSFGTNNSGRELGRMDYALRMVRECGLRWQDIFVPKP
jgi:hypothetical protein